MRYLNERLLHIQSSNKRQLHKETVLSRSLYQLLNKAFYAWDSSPHLLVTPAQLMRPGISWNISCAVGDFARPIFLGRCGLLIVHEQLKCVREPGIHCLCMCLISHKSWKLGTIVLYLYNSDTIIHTFLYTIHTFFLTWVEVLMISVFFLLLCGPSSRKHGASTFWSAWIFENHATYRT